jgi:hypothetical protein
MPLSTAKNDISASSMRIGSILQGSDCFEQAISGILDIDRAAV